MVKLALLVRLEAKPGKEKELGDFLASALPMAQNEPGTVHWFALRIGPSTYGIFDTFEKEEGRQAHLNGPIAAALVAGAPELLSAPPVIEQVNKKMKTQFKTILQSRITLLTIVLAFILVNGCTSNASDSHSTASAASADSKSKPADEIVPPKNPDGFSGAIGNVVKFSGNEVEITTSDKPLVIKLTDSLHVYAPSPSSLANVKGSAYIGVVSKKQTDQPDQAIKVLILPEELRGLNEGSFMLPAEKAAESEGRMTNGSASDVASSGDSRMSNGSVAEAGATSLTLQFQGHSRTVNVPPNTPVVEYKVSDKKPAPGDKIFLLVRKGDHDALVSSKIVFF